MHTEEQVNELYHYGVKGMKWGVRKNTDASDSKNISRRVKRLNRINSSMEKYDTINHYVSNMINNTKKSKNPLEKMYGISHESDRKFSEMMYNRYKKKVDELLADLERDGVTLKELEERKFRLTSGSQSDYITEWMGVKYSVIDQFADDK